EPAGTAAEIPVLGDIEVAVYAEVPALQLRIGNREAAIAILDREVAEIGVAAFDAEQHARGDRPAIADVGAETDVRVVIEAFRRARLADVPVDEKTALVGGVAGQGDCGQTRGSEGNGN